VTTPDPAEAAASWEAIADGWTERMRTGTDAPRKYLLDRAHLELAGDILGKRVLDAGCGEGRYARMLAERGAKVTGIDLSERMIEHARKAEAEAPLGIEYAVTDMADLSMFGDETFDQAVAYLSLIDVFEYERAIAEISRVLRPGAAFIFSLVHPCFYPPTWEWVPRVPGTVPLRDADRLYLKIDNYFPAAEVRFKMWPTAPTETINYHRPLTDYARALKAAGFLTRDIIEPTPDPEIAEKFDYWNYHFRAPNFIVFECVKGPR
jgi:SAM-dependent methyltransferase